MLFQLTQAQNDLNSTNGRKQQLETELASARTELRDYKQRVHDVNNRVTELQRTLQDAHSEKSRLDERILAFEKVRQNSFFALFFHANNKRFLDDCD